MPLSPEEQANKLNAFLRANNGTGNYVAGTRLSGNYIDVPKEFSGGDYVIADGVFMQKNTFNNLMQQHGYTGTRDITPQELESRNITAQTPQGMKNIAAPGKPPLYVPIAPVTQESLEQGKVSATGVPLPFGLSQEDLKNPAVQISLQNQGYDINGQKLGSPLSDQRQENGNISQEKPQSAEQVTQSTKDFLKSIGVSDDLINSLQPRDINTFAMMQQVMQKKAENDEKLAPKNLTLEEMNSYLEDAKKELDPYYQEQFDFAKQDLLQNIAFQTGQLQDLEAMQATQFQQQQEQLGGQMAESGLAQSGIRQEAERRLREQQQGIVKSQRRQLGQNIYNVGSEIERTFGSQKASSLYPTLTSQAQAGLPEQQLGYNPLGGRMGTMSKEQTVATRQERDRLALIEMQKRQLLAGQ